MAASQSGSKLVSYPSRIYPFPRPDIQSPRPAPVAVHGSHAVVIMRGRAHRESDTSERGAEAIYRREWGAVSRALPLTAQLLVVLTYDVSAQ